MDGQKHSSDEIAARAALIAAARARVAAQDSKFTIKALCEETGISRPVFRKCFAGKQDLMAALLQDQPAPVLADAWLERRLRVFERALTGLEARAETAARDQSIAIARLEERLTQVAGQPGPEIVVTSQPVETKAILIVHHDPERQAEIAEDAVVAPTEPAVSKDEMAAFLETARNAAREAQARAAAGPVRPSPWRSLMVAGLALLTTFLICAVLTLGHAAFAPVAGGVSHRQIASAGLAREMARADGGDAQAQAGLALAYLRGDGVAHDDAAAARWAHAAARHGVPAAQYLLGALYREGQGVPADSHQALFWFQAAARGGNVKAMHNLGIAYAEGQGAAADPALAAAWFGRAAKAGYRDSAFDLAVLYERGLGVRQNLKDALKWYQAAAAAGDGPSADRAAVLQEQIADSR